MTQIRDEQAEHEAFEQLVGGPNRGFRLMRLYSSCGSCKDRYTDPAKRESKEAFFRRMAKRDGYTEEQINAFLNLQ